MNENALGFSQILTLIFITLKLTGAIDWSWVWVLSPLWIPIMIIIGSAAIFLILLWIFSCGGGE